MTQIITKICEFTLEEGGFQDEFNFTHPPNRWVQFTEEDIKKHEMMFPDYINVYLHVSSLVILMINNNAVLNVGRQLNQLQHPSLANLKELM